MTADAIAVTVQAWEPRDWAAAARAAAPERRVFLWPDVPDPASVGYALAWSPEPGALATFPNLKVVFALGAGVDNVIADPMLPDVPIVRVVSESMTRRMTEWVVWRVLAHHRRADLYAAQQSRREWWEAPQPSAADVRVGVMGMGELGRDAATVLVRLGFQVAGWSRRRSNVEGVVSFAGSAELSAFLARTDILVCLLPLTPETRGILAMPLFRQLAHDGALGAPVVINAGRGGLQVEADIIAALDDGTLGGASLDVFETEPLPEASPLWLHPKVTITPHAAAWSSPAELVPPIIAQIRKSEAGEPLRNVVDRQSGY